MALGKAPPPKVEVLEDKGLRKAINGYTWPGIEFGEPPSCAYTFFEYVDAIRHGDLQKFLQVEAGSRGWYFPSLDRGAGALLHFAVDHGQLAAVKFLVEQRGVEVNQRDRGRGWTPLMRCARMAHYKHAPFLQVFEYLLQQGADPGVRSLPAASITLPSGNPPSLMGLAQQLLGPEDAGEQGVLDVAVEKGWGWEPGAVRAELSRLIERYSGVPKKPAYMYSGPPTDELARQLMAAWESLPKLYPPENWRAPPPAGFVDAQGVRRISQDGWRPAGDRDGSHFMRPMTEQELKEQAERC